MYFNAVLFAWHLHFSIYYISTTERIYEEISIASWWTFRVRVTVSSFKKAWTTHRQQAHTHKQVAYVAWWWGVLHKDVWMKLAKVGSLNSLSSFSVFPEGSEGKMGKEEFGEASSSKTERELTECEFHHHLHHHHPHPHHPLSVPHGPWERRWRQEGGRGKKGQRRSGRGGIRRSDQGRKGASKGDRGWQQKAEAEEDRGRRGKGRESWVKLGSQTTSELLTLCRSERTE